MREAAVANFWAQSLCSALVLALPGCKVEAHPPVEATPTGTTADGTAPSTGSPPLGASGGLLVTPARPVARAMPKYEPGPTSAALCQDFVSKARQHDATLPTVGDFGGGGFPVSTFDTACLPTPRGAWALEVAAVRPTTGIRDGKRVTERLEGSYHAVHLVDPPGTRSEGPPVPFVVSEWASFMLDQQLFDYDGDGEPELLLHTQTTEHTAAGTSSETVYAASGGTVARYGPAAAFPTTMSEDIDSDGRPDLLYRGEEPFRIDGTPDTRHTSMVLEVLFAAHSLPDGKFSAHDAAAVAYVKKQCPAAPASVVAGAFGSVDEEASVKNVHCARAWGVAAVDIKAQITRDCVRPKKDDRGRKGPRTCSNFDMMMTWAEFVPPVSLADAGP